MRYALLVLTILMGGAAGCSLAAGSDPPAKECFYVPDLVCCDNACQPIGDGTDAGADR